MSYTEDAPRVPVPCEEVCDKNTVYTVQLI